MATQTRFSLLMLLYYKHGSLKQSDLVDGASIWADWANNYFEDMRDNLKASLESLDVLIKHFDA